MVGILGWIVFGLAARQRRHIRARRSASRVRGRQADAPAISSRPALCSCVETALAISPSDDGSSCDEATEIGIVKEKVAPPSSFPTAQMRPPCASTMVRQIDRPTPVPDAFVV
jgi:hypothetical protein